MANVLEKIDDPCPIDDLSDELLSKILRNSLDLSNATLVCRRWRVLIENEIGRTAYIYTFPPSTSNPNQQCVGIDFISKTGIRHCYINRHCATTPTEAPSCSESTSSSSNWLPYKFKFPQLVKSLHLHGYLPDLDISDITTGLQNLQKLEMGLDYLLEIRNISCVKELQLENLTILNVGFQNSTPLAISLERQNSINLVMANIFQNEFSRLRCFGFKFPVFSNDEITVPLLHFINHHASSLETLALDFRDFQTDQSVSTLKDIKYATTFAKKLATLLHITELSILGNFVPSKLVQIKVWTEFCMNLRTLRHLFLHKFRLRMSVLESMCMLNNKSLTKIILENTVVANELNNDCQCAVNCRTFFACSSLEFLLVKAWRISGLTLVPKSVKVCIFSGRMVRFDCEYLLTHNRLPNMDYLALLQPGFTNGFGITIDLLTRAIAARNINTLFITGVRKFVDGVMPRRGISNADPDVENFELLWPRRVTWGKRDIKMMYLTKNTKGYYRYNHPIGFKSVVLSDFNIKVDLDDWL